MIKDMNEAEFAAWFKGFVEGEGCFHLDVSQTDTRIGYGTRAGFTINQTMSRGKVIRDLHKRLKSGYLNKRKGGVTYHQSISLVMRSKTDVLKIIKILDKTKWGSPGKELCYNIWKNIFYKIRAGEHLTKEGFLNIIKLSDDLNKDVSKNRKYNYQYFKTHGFAIDEAKKEKRKERVRQWYIKNKRWINANQREYYINNKEKYRLYHKRYYGKNKDKESARRKEYRKKNIDKERARGREYYRKNIDKLKARARDCYKKKKMLSIIQTGR